MDFRRCVAVKMKILSKEELQKKSQFKLGYETGKRLYEEHKSLMKSLENK